MPNSYFLEAAMGTLTSHPSANSFYDVLGDCCCAYKRTVQHLSFSSVDSSQFWITFYMGVQGSFFVTSSCTMFHRLIRCWDSTSFHEKYRITAGLGGAGSGRELCIWSLLILRWDKAYSQV